MKKCPKDISKDEILDSLSNKLDRKISYLNKLSKDELCDLEIAINSLEINIRFKTEQGILSRISQSI